MPEEIADLVKKDITLLESICTLIPKNYIFNLRETTYDGFNISKSKSALKNSILGNIFKSIVEKFLYFDHFIRHFEVHSKAYNIKIMF